MKKIKALYKGYMLRPIVYKSVMRVLLALVLVLARERFTGSGKFAAFRDTGIVVGAVFLMAAWFCYLKLDDFKIKLFGVFRKPRKKKKRMFDGDMIDHMYEQIVSFDELEPEEQTACLLAADLFTGVLYLSLSLALTLVS